MTADYAHNTYLHHATVIPNKVGKQYCVKFKLKYPAQPGESICVIGGIPELGNFKKHTFFLRETEGNIWVNEKVLSTD